MAGWGMVVVVVVVVVVAMGGDSVGAIRSIGLA
jgi:hypothetical protein